ncbi:MAG: ATP-binding cassette domain-containing protein [Candidatus Azobacteroides sp.]|nr:ATP-binding cassette domain-containing protein [Candidatus Azobacteroides sp.]
MITINDISISYERQIIDSLSLSLPDNNIHGIVGLNGAGKTTLLNTIFGLKKPDSGSILFDGIKLSKKEISYMTTENFFYMGITGEEYLNLFKNEKFELNQWNKLFSLPLNQTISKYSTGMKKRLALMGILKQNKPIMIFDEPFNGLDIEACRIIRSILLGLKEQGKTIIITSHIIETLTNLCDYIHYLENGKIKYSKIRTEFDDFQKELFENIEQKNNKLINYILKN